MSVGGLDVSIFGSGLADATNVLFGGIASASFTVLSDDEITATTPAHAAGRVDVTVRTLASDLTLSDAFLYTGTDTTVEWCNVQWPPSTSIAAGTISELIFGQVFALDITEVEGTCGPGLLAQLGYGRLDSDPSATHGWTWTEAACDPLCPSCGANDEYMATITLDVAGEYAYAYRFSTDDGVNYRYCDTSGSTDGDPYDPASQGLLTVSPH